MQWFKGSTLIHNSNNDSRTTNVKHIKGVWQNFICCGCAFGCVLTILPPLSSAKVLEFYQEYWMLLGNKSQPQHYDVVEALHSFIWQCETYKKCLTSVICCGCAYGCVLTMILPLSLTKRLGFYCWESMLGNKPQHYIWWLRLFTHS